ncbi:MAG: DUF1778 domain-containing protein [Gammaproteobacteria bacterium]|nr:DUF1778 domain-containing protein [Gammaproteobacteria bacterium]
MATATTTLMVRLDEASKACIAKAAQMRHISISDYVRSITVTQAEREVREAERQMIALAPHEQLAFWNALNEPPELTDAQKALGALMRGE